MNSVGRKLASKQSVFFATSTIFLGYGTYKAKYDPLHIVWDLDHTIICSITPVEEAIKCTEGLGDLDYIDHIDDDFDFEDGIPNTRTFFRPGSRTLIQFLGFFAFNHVYTAAQGTYTKNIMDKLDPKRTLYHTITHRDIVPHHDYHHESETKFIGKDLTVVPGLLQTGRLHHRAILFDDRVYNFDPQPENGVHVKGYHDITGYPFDWEVCRMAVILFLAHFSNDVRTVLPLFRSPIHNSKYPLKQQPNESKR